MDEGWYLRFQSLFFWGCGFDHVVSEAFGTDNVGRQCRSAVLEA